MSHLAGFQITAHCIGDNAVEKMIHTIEYVTTKYPRKNCRPRIEHCAMIDKENVTADKKSLELFQSVIRDLLHLMQKITTDIMETESI